MAFWQIGQPLQAAVVYWDIDGTTAGAGGATPTGTWDGTNAFWNSLYDGTGSTAAWLAGDTAVFSAGTNATGAYTVTVSGTQVIGGLGFEEGTVTLGGGILDLGGAQRTVSVASGGSATINSVLTGTGGGINKTGTGILELSGANSYTGTTSISNGTLRLNFNAAGAPATDIVYNGVTPTGLTFGTATGGGATLSMIGAAGATSQTFGGITLSALSGAAITVDASAGGAATLALGGITRAANNGSSIRFTLPATGSITTTATNDASGILGPWAVVGSGATQRYATVSGGAIAAYSGGTAITDINSATSATTNYDITTLTTGLLTAARTANSIRVATAGASTIDLGAGAAFNLSTNGLMNVSGGTLSITRQSGGTGVLRPATSTGTPEIVFSGSSQIDVGGGVAVTNNTAASRAIVNMDPGVALRLTNSAANTGGWVINSGTLIVDVGNNGNIGSSTASTVTINNGGILRTQQGNNSISDTTTVNINAGGLWQYAQNNTDTIAALTGAGTITRTDVANNNTQTISVSSGTGTPVWAGTISDGDANTLLAFTKTGANVVEFTGNNTYTGVTSINQNRLIISGPDGRVAGNVTVGDNNGADEVLQLGRLTDVIHGEFNHVANTATVTLQSNAASSSFDLQGPAIGSTASTETIGTLTFGTGRNVATLTQAAGGTVQLTAGALSRANSGTGLIRGAGLGATGADTTRVLFTTAPAGANFIGGSTTAGALNLNIIPYLLGDLSTAGPGTGFVTHDATNGVRLLTGAEYASTLAGNAGNNISLAGGETLNTTMQNLAVNSLRITAGTTTINNSTAPALGAVTVNSGAVLFTGSGTLTGTARLNLGTAAGVISAAANTTPITGSIANRITGSGGIATSSYGDVANVVSLDGANMFTGGVVVNSGILSLSNAGALGSGTALNLVTVRTAATLRLNGNNTVVSGLVGAQGSTVSNGSATTASSLRVHTTADQTFTGQITNGGTAVIHLVKTGTFTQIINGTLAAANNYTGATVISQGILNLSGNTGGAILNTSGFSIGGGGTLRLTSSSGGNSQGNRVNASTIVLRGGTFDFDHNSDTNTSYSETAGILSISAGSNQVIVDRAATGTTVRSSILTFSDGTAAVDLSRTQGAVVLFAPNTLGTGTGVEASRNRVVFTTAPTLNDGIIGGWAYANDGADFATYSADVDLVTAGNQPSVTALTTYSTDLAEASWATGTNVFMNAAPATLAAARTVNSLKITSTGGTNTLNLGGFGLIVDAGGILYNGTGTNTFTGISNGTITAQGGATAAPDLVVRTNSATDTITLSANIIDGAGGATGFTKSGPGTIVLSGTNSYTGPTAIVGGALNVSADGHLGTAPGSASAGHLKIYDATLNTTANVTLNANRLIEIGGASATISAAAGTNLIYNGAISATIPTGSNIPDVTNLTVSGNVDSAFSGGLLVGGNLQWFGPDSGASVVSLAGASNVVNGQFWVGGDEGTVNMTYGVTGGVLNIGALDPGATEFRLGVRNATVAPHVNTIGTLDLTGSQDFNVTVQNFRLGENVGGSSGSNTQGVLTIGTNSNIVVNNEIRIGHSPGDGNTGLTSSVAFGSGVNNVTTTTMTVGGQKGLGAVTIVSGGTLNLGGLRPQTAELRIAYNNADTGTVNNGSFNTTGGTLVTDLGTVTVGFASGNGVGGATGTMTIGTSTSNMVNVLNLVVGDQRGSGTGTTANTASGTFTFGGGTLAVGNNFTIGNLQANNTAARTVTGTANLNGGTTSVAGLLTVANAIPAGGTGAHTASGTLNVTAGTLTTTGDLRIGNTVSNIATGHASTGTMNINHASSVVTVGGNIDLARVDSSVGNPTATGTLNLTAGSLTVTGNIAQVQLNGADASQTRGFVNVAGGALDMTSGTINAKTLAFRSGSISNATTVTLDAGSATSTTTISGATGDALILRDVTAAFNVALTGATASNVHYENAGGGSGGTLSGNLDLGTVARTFNIEDSAGATTDMTVSGIVSNSGPITKTGAGTLVLSGANTFSGALTVSTGTLVAGSNQGLSNANVAVNVAGGAFLNAGGFSNTIGALTGVGTVQNDAVAAGVLSLGGGNASSSFSGTIQNGAGGGALGITKIGTGTVDLTGGANLTFTGPTVVNGGVLNAGIRGSTSVSVNGGALNLADNTAFSLNLGNAGNVLQLSNSAILGFEIGVAPDQFILGAGGLGLTSGNTTVNINGLSGFGAGTYTLINAPSGGLKTTNGSTGTFALGTAPSGFTYLLNHSDTILELVVAAFSGKYWRGDVNGSWATNNAGDTNWNDSASGTVDAGAVPTATDSVLFSNSNATGPVISTTLDAAFEIKDLLFLSQPTGVTDVNVAAGTGGTLKITASNATTEGISVAAGAGNITISAPLTVGADQRWEVANAAGTSLTISGAIDGTDDATKTGAGALTLSGANSSYTGTLGLSVGQMNLNSATAPGSGTLAINGGTLDNTSGSAITQTVNPAQTWNGSFAFGGSNNLTFGTGAVTLTNNITLTANGSGILTQQGNIGGAFSVTKAGTGTTVFAGNSSAYSGGTVINAGALTGVVTGASGTPLGSGTVQINGGALALRGDGTGNDGTITVGNDLLVSGNVIVDVDRVAANTGNSFALDDLSIGAFTLTMNSANGYGLTFATGTLTGNATLNNAAGVLAVSGVLGESGGARSLTKTGAGTLALNGANTFTGGVVQTGGIINLGHVQGLGTGLYNVTGASTLNPTANLAVANAITLDAGLTITGTSNLTLSGALTNSAGNQTLTNNLNLANTLTLSGLINLSETNTARTLALSGSGNTVQDAASVIQNGGTAAGILEKNGTGTLTLNGDNTYTGETILRQGTLILGHRDALGGTSARLQTVTNNSVVQASADLIGANALPNALTLNVGTTTFSGSNSIQFSSTTINNGGNRTLTNNLDAGEQLILGAVALSNDGTNRTLTLRGTGETLVTGVISNGSTSTAGNVVKNDIGTLIFAGANTYAGTTTISAGVLQVGNGGTTGTLTSGAGAVTNNATLRINRTNAVTLANSIGGTGTLEQVGSGVTTLTGTNSYSGVTTVSAGGLTVGNNGTAGNLGTGNVNLSNSATLTFNRSDAISVANNITGTGNLTKTSTGPVTLTGVNTFAGTITVLNNSLIAGGASAFGNAGNNVVVQATGAGITATLDLNGNSYSAGTVTLGGTTATSTPVISTGAGTLTLGGDVTYLATSNPLGGTISGSLALGSASRIFDVGNSTNATDDLTVSAAIGGGAGVNFAKNGAGTLVLTGANTWQGSTTINAGTLRIGSGGTTGSLGTAATLINDGTLEIRRSDAFALTQSISGTGNLVQSGAGTTTVSGTNTYSGTTTVSAGELKAGSTSAFGANSAVSVSGGAILSLDGNSNVIGSLAGAGTLQNANAVAATLTTGGNGSTTTFSGVVQDGTGAGSLSLVKQGAGIFTLTGANTYTGKTTVNGGTLSIASDGNLGAAPVIPVSDQLTLDGGTLRVTASTTLDANRGVTVGVGHGTIETSTAVVATISGVVAGSGDLTKTGDGTLLFTAANTNSGTVTVSAGTLGGIGSTGGSVIVQSTGSLAPGASAGQFTVGGNLTVSGSVVMELGGVTTNDAAAVLNELTLNGNLTNLAVLIAYENANSSLHDHLRVQGGAAPVFNTGSVFRISSSFLNSYIPSYGDIFDLMDWTFAGPVSGTPTFDLPTLSGGLAFNTDLFATSGLIVVVPEPSKAVLMLLGLLGLLGRRRREH